MCRQRLPLYLVLACTAFGPTQAARSQNPAPTEVRWRYDYNAARKEAQDKGLPLVIDFGTETCFWCRKLDESTFRDPRVVSSLNERYVALKIDAEKEPSLSQTLRISSYPTIVFAAPDGKILGTIEGFKDANFFHESLQRVIGTLINPDWMVRDYQQAVKLAAAKEYARAIPALRAIVEDGLGRPVQLQAQKLLNDIEQEAVGRVAQAQEMLDRGQTAEAIRSLTETLRLFPGLQSTRQIPDVLTRLAQNPGQRNQNRLRQAQELLVQARDFFKAREFLISLDRCEVLIAGFGDLAEAQEASQIAAEIRANPEWLQSACDTLSDRLSGMYLALADTLLKRGQAQQAELYLERIIRTFPGSRQAESAQIRLGQLRGQPARRVEVGATDR
jgi:thioredoxin-like negative regulator of GroEL